MAKENTNQSKESELERIIKIFTPRCLQKDDTISPTMKPKDGELYCNHQEIYYCPYRNNTKREMRCNYYKHQSLINSLTEENMEK